MKMLFSWDRRADNPLLALLNFKERSQSASGSSDLHLGKEVVIFTAEVATCPRPRELVRGRTGIRASASYFSLGVGGGGDGWT